MNLSLFVFFLYCYTWFQLFCSVTLTYDVTAYYIHLNDRMDYLSLGYCCSDDCIAVKDYYIALKDYVTNRRL